MDYFKKVIGFFLLFSLLQCQLGIDEKKGLPQPLPLEQLQSFSIKVAAPKKRKKRTGKLNHAEVLPQTYTNTLLSNFTLPYINHQLTEALKDQLQLLKLRKQDFTQDFDNISLNLSDLQTTIELLLLWKQTFPQGLNEHLNAYQLKGRDGKGNVYFTGYFTPEIKVKKTRDAHYRYPLYAYPEDWSGQLPTRKEIDGENILRGRGLELAYTPKLEDIYYMQLQGSGMVQYPGGRRSYFGFAGTNQRAYKSIGTHIKNNKNIPLRNISMEGVKNFLDRRPEFVESILFVNDSYVFFEETKAVPKGAGHVPLTTDYSIAVDTDHLPLGSCLLAALPVLDEDGYFSHHEYRFVVAQDVGGRIRGNGHVDVYCGIGKEGEKKAMALHHYGQLWLLLPKPAHELGPVLSPAIARENMEE